MTHAAQSSAPTRSCPRCLQANAASAAFCGTCGASMTAAPPPPPPEDSRWRMPGGRSLAMSGASPSATEGVIGADPGTVHAAVLAVLGAQGVSIAPAQPGLPIRFTRELKSFLLTGGMRVRYQGEVVMAPNGIGQTMVRVQHKVDWGSATGFLLILLACGVYFAASNGGGGMVLLFVLGLGGYNVWALATQKPETWGRELLAELPSRIAMAAGGVRQDPPAAPGQRVWTAGPAGSGAPGAPGTGAPLNTGTREGGMLEKFKVLQELRTHGIITADDFERMKSELLKSR